MRSRYSRLWSVLICTGLLLGISDAEISAQDPGTRQASVLLQLSEEYQEQDSIGLAIEWADRALPLLTNDPSKMGEVQLRLAKLYQELNAYDRGLNMRMRR